MKVSLVIRRTFDLSQGSPTKWRGLDVLHAANLEGAYHSGEYPAVVEVTLGEVESPGLAHWIKWQMNHGGDLLEDQMLQLTAGHRYRLVNDATKALFMLDGMEEPTEITDDDRWRIRPLVEDYPRTEELYELLRCADDLPGDLFFRIG